MAGSQLVGLAAARGAEVIATAGPASHERLRRLGAAHVLDYHDPDWPEQARAIAGGLGVAAVANAVPNGSAVAIGTVRDGGRLATITQDPPDEQRGIEISSVIVEPDGRALGELAELLAAGKLEVSTAATFPLGTPPRPSRQERGAAPAERSCFAPDVHARDRGRRHPCPPARAHRRVSAVQRDHRARRVGSHPQRQLGLEAQGAVAPRSAAPHGERYSSGRARHRALGKLDPGPDVHVDDHAHDLEDLLRAEVIGEGVVEALECCVAVGVGSAGQCLGVAERRLLGLGVKLGLPPRGQGVDLGLGECPRRAPPRSAG